MSPESQRVAIAESVGYTKETRGQHNWVCLRDPAGNILNNCYGDNPCYLPDYLNDLNAMHKVEKALTCSQWNAYMHYLRKLAPHRNGHHATAAQRAEAYLRTINKWSDEQ